MRSRAVLVVVIAVGLALIGWAIFGRETDEEAIRRRLAEMSEVLAIDPSEGLVVRGLRLKRDLPGYLTDDATFQVPEAGGDMTRNEVVSSATAAATRWPSAVVGWSDVAVVLDGRGGAQVEGDAELTRRDEGGGRSTRRHVSMAWTKDGAWKVRTLAVGARSGPD